MKVKEKLDSVQQICDRCSQMIAETEDTPYIDVAISANNVRVALSDLKDTFDREPEAERKIYSLKLLAERNAISLETLMYHRDGLYEETVKLRRFADKLFTDCRDIFEYLSKNTPKEEQALLFKWGEYVKWSLLFYTQSKHILFSVDEEDEAMIKKITADMQSLIEEGKVVYKNDKGSSSNWFATGKS